MFTRVVILTVVALFLAGEAQSRDRTDLYEQFRSENERYEFEFDESLVEQWKEQVKDVPKLNLKKLRELDIDHGPVGAAVYVDESSLTVNEKDRMVRYWMVMKTGSGRYGSMSYEGIRCGTGQYKNYAYTSARDPDNIRPIKSPKWREIRQNTRDPRHEMARDYFCAGVIPRTQAGVIKAVRGHVAPWEDTSADLLKR
ncbi:hypothetical protein BOW39_00720 [Solemya velum gill symbiont]|uniref:CNP1-like family protein n=1 Tax=Solemya velum gill symbiont TaxID=2340 RepID=UPI0009CD8598|nr:CNP1-like family protein [Solemya velum gill symbiont]OOZ51161.1 hypothetical protein BOW39_00720 [Solemya velum gill symbiont]